MASSRAASAEYQPRCCTASKFCLLCWLLSEKLVGFEMWNVVNEYHYSVRTVFNKNSFLRVVSIRTELYTVTYSPFSLVTTP